VIFRQPVSVIGSCCSTASQDTAASAGQRTGCPEWSSPAAYPRGRTQPGIAGRAWLAAYFAESTSTCTTRTRTARSGWPKLAKNSSIEAIYGSAFLAPWRVFDVHGEILPIVSLPEIDLGFSRSTRNSTSRPPITVVAFNSIYARTHACQRTSRRAGTCATQHGQVADLRIGRRRQRHREEFHRDPGGCRHVNLTAFGSTPKIQAHQQAHRRWAEMGTSVTRLSGITQSAITYEIEGGNGKRHNYAECRRRRGADSRAVQGTNTSPRAAVRTSLRRRPGTTRSMPEAGNDLVSATTQDRRGRA